MDEPTSAFDPISTLKIEELIFKLKKNYTIIIVTHNMQQAHRISDKTAFFLLGEMIEFDSTQVSKYRGTRILMCRGLSRYTQKYNTKDCNLRYHASKYQWL